MKQRVTISFVEDLEDDSEVFWNVVAREFLLKWSYTAREINVSVTALPSDEERERYLSIVRAHYGEAGVEPVAASNDEERGYATMSGLRRHYGCDDGGAQ